MIRSVSLTPDGKWAFSGSDDMTVRLWDLRNPESINSYPLSGHVGVIVSVALTPDGIWALSGSVDKTARLWNLKNLRILSLVSFQGTRTEYGQYLLPRMA